MLRSKRRNPKTHLRNKSNNDGWKEEKTHLKTISLNNEKQDSPILQEESILLTNEGNRRITGWICGKIRRRDEWRKRRSKMVSNEEDDTDESNSIEGSQQSRHKQDESIPREPKKNK